MSTKYIARCGILRKSLKFICSKPYFLYYTRFQISRSNHFAPHPWSYILWWWWDNNQKWYKTATKYIKKVYCGISLTEKKFGIIQLYYYYYYYYYLWIFTQDSLFSGLMSCYQWWSCLPCETHLQRSPLKLAMISNFHHWRPHRGVELGTFRS